MPNPELSAVYFMEWDVIDFDFMHYIRKYDYPVSGDELRKMGAK